MNLSRSVLTVDGAPVSAGDVLASAFLGGRLVELRRHVALGLAAQSLAAEAEEELDEDEFQQALDGWRVERDLIAAEEFERWLGARGLELDDVLGCLERDLLARRHPKALDEVEPDEAEVLELLPVESEVGGTMGRLREEHARRVVAPKAMDDAERAAARAEVLAAAGLSGVEDAAAFLAVTGTSPERAEELLEREADFACFRHALLADDVREDALKRMSGDLVRYELVSAELRTEDAARELMCCIRTDRDPFLRSAARAGVPVKRQLLFASDVEHLPFGYRLPSARTNDLFGPHETGTGHLVAQLLGRREPTLAEADVRARLDEKLLARTLSRPITERVGFRLEEAS